MRSRHDFLARYILNYANGVPRGYLGDDAFNC